MKTQHAAKSDVPTSARGPGSLEMLAVWAMVAFMSLAVFITYARVPVSELYHVSREGIAGGASRALTFLSYPVGFIAIALIAFAFARLYPVLVTRSMPFKLGVVVASVLALAFSLVAALPGVVDQGNLDARLVNAIPAAGVGLAIALTILSLWVVGAGETAPWTMGDRLRLGITALAIFLALPWILADLGIYIGDVPGLGAIFMSREIPAGETLRAVHLGDHHGTNGVMFLLAGLWLSRELPWVGPMLLRGTIAAYVSLMMVYGAFNAAQDFWLEQVVKRGWATVEMPNMLRPALTPAWGLLVLGTVIVAAVMIRLSTPGRDAPKISRREPPVVTRERARV